MDDASTAAEVFHFPPLPWNFDPVFLVAPLHMQLPPELFAELAAHVDAECKNPHRASYDHELAGQIRHGEQIDATRSLPARLKVLFTELGRGYILRLAEVNGRAVNADLQVAFGSSWIVLSRERDYNPAHKHDGHVAGIVYVKVPEAVAHRPTPDGKLNFLFGQFQEHNVDFLGVREVTPVVGDLYIFPAWLGHVVYPFEGPGERVSYSFNLYAQNIRRPTKN